MSKDKLRIEYVPLETMAAWDENPKMHDVGGIIVSIERYGFKDPPKFEPRLNGGKGGIVEGNGRALCLKMMLQEGRDPPRGVVEETGEDGKVKGWAVPIIFGVDAGSEDAAKAYAIDHNNLTMAGGDFDGFDMSRMWSADYPGLLADMSDFPVTIDGEEIASILRSRDIVTQFLDDGEYAKHAGRVPVAEGQVVAVGRFSAILKDDRPDRLVSFISKRWGEDPDLAVPQFVDWILAL